MTERLAVVEMGIVYAEDFMRKLDYLLQHRQFSPGNALAALWLIESAVVSVRGALTEARAWECEDVTSAYFDFPRRALFGVLRHARAARASTSLPELADRVGRVLGDPELGSPLREGIRRLHARAAEGFDDRTSSTYPALSTEVLATYRAAYFRFARFPNLSPAERAVAAKFFVRP